MKTFLKWAGIGFGVTMAYAAGAIAVILFLNDDEDWTAGGDDE